MTRFDQFALVAGLIALALAALGWVLDARGFAAGWLSAVVLFSAWPLGSIAVILIHTLTGGKWGEVLRPALFTGVCALPLLVLALIPLAVVLPDIYDWARPEAHLPNEFYLNVPFFAVRTIIYLIVWLGLGGLILRGGPLHGVAPAGLFLLAVTVTFAAIDTTLSVDPHFVSSIYGMVVAAGMGLFALSMAVLLTAGDIAPRSREHLGKLLLALVILWIYLNFMQLLIVWQSNLAAEAPWYLDRSRGFWGAVRIIIVLGHFVLPFALLLSPRMQRSAAVITTVATALVIVGVLRAWWTVLPSLQHAIGWIDIACMIGLGGIGLGFAPWAALRPSLARRSGHV